MEELQITNTMLAMYIWIICGFQFLFVHRIFKYAKTDAVREFGKLAYSLFWLNIITAGLIYIIFKGIELYLKS